jgi:hypothetical protein
VRSFHSQSIIAKPGDGRAHIDRRATVITFVETDRWITNSSGNVGVQLCLAVALKELQPSCGRRAPPDRQAFDIRMLEGRSFGKSVVKVDA